MPIKSAFLIFLVSCTLLSCMPLAIPPATIQPLQVPTFTSTPIPLPETATETSVPTETPLPSSLIVGIVGDFGTDDQDEADVAALIHSWKPDIIISLGDNNYYDGEADTIDANIGQYYHDYIFPYNGDYGAGADVNRFFPVPGNHDWIASDAQPYLDFFTLPGNERYYDFTYGSVHFFALDSDENEPDGIDTSSAQAEWFQEAIAASTSAWNIVFFHHAPYSSGDYHGSSDWMQWPFAAWGADAVLAGHEHSYERLLVDNIPYFVNGLGGGEIYDFGPRIPETQYRYHADYGAMLMTVTEQEIIFEFYSRDGTLQDSYIETK